MSEIRIDAPGAGEWIMKQVGGYFVPSIFHSLSTHDHGRLLGGFVVADHVRHASAAVHMAGVKPGWCTRQLLWALFEYVFHELEVKKLFALIRSNNYSALEQCLRAGYCVETVVRDVYPEGVHGVLLYMTEANCVWLKHRPKIYGVTRDNVLLFHQPETDAA